MPTETMNPMIEALATALETLAFAALAPALERDRAPEEIQLLQLRYVGPDGPGTVELAAPLQLGRVLLRNTMADEIDAGSTPPAPLDPLVELLNIAGGLLLRQRFAGRKVQMHVPELHPFNTSRNWKPFIADPRTEVVSCEGLTLAIRHAEGAA